MIQTYFWIIFLLKFTLKQKHMMDKIYSLSVTKKKYGSMPLQLFSDQDL